MGVAGRARAREVFVIDRTVDETLAVYEAVFAGEQFAQACPKGRFEGLGFFRGRCPTKGVWVE